MNWNYFNTLGYLSVVLWLAMPVLWLLHARMRPRRWLCHIALLLGVVALFLAKSNSENHVNQIQLDRSGQLAELEEKKDAKRQAAMDLRGDEVADIRFAEDGSEDFMDQAGMDQADLKYTKSLDKPASPDWKKGKQKRSSGSADDGGLESAIGANEKRSDLNSDALKGMGDEKTITMSAKDLEMANLLDLSNLRMIRFLILLGIAIVIIDYLRRANVYREAYLPLPLPSRWFAGKPPEAVFVRPEPARRDIAGELKWMAKRGDVFLYLTNNIQKAVQLPESLPRFGKKWSEMDVIHTDANESLGDDFIFEALWYGRSSFAVDSAARAKVIFGSILKMLEQRRGSRARVSQTVHIVWDLDEPIPEKLCEDFARFGRTAGFSLFICTPQDNGTPLS